MIEIGKQNSEATQSELVMLSPLCGPGAHWKAPVRIEIADLTRLSGSCRQAPAGEEKLHGARTTGTIAPTFRAAV
jgi:hypothetical protein